MHNCNNTLCLMLPIAIPVAIDKVGSACYGIAKGATNKHPGGLLIYIHQIRIPWEK